MTTFDTKALRKAVQQAAMVCNPRGRIPILKQIRITATGETATVNASNLGIDLSITVPCDGDCDFFISPTLWRRCCRMPKAALSWPLTTRPSPSPPMAWR